MSNLNDFEEVIYDWVETNVDPSILPCEFEDLNGDKSECFSLDDVSECFVRYLGYINFDDVLYEQPSAITRIDVHFDVFEDDCLTYIGSME